MVWGGICRESGEEIARYWWWVSAWRVLVCREDWRRSAAFGWE